jgi:hypothetical protein
LNEVVAFVGCWLRCRDAFGCTKVKTVKSDAKFEGDNAAKAINKTAK